jgi:hypothetical protein
MRDDRSISENSTRNDLPARSIVAATLGNDGNIGDVRVLDAKLSLPRTHVHQTPFFGQHLYSVGGRDANDHSVGLVDIATFK